MNYSNVREVSARATAGEYECVVDLLIGSAWVAAPYTAVPGGGGICDAILADIADGNFDGEIAPYVEPPAALPHETPLTRAQWWYGLDRHGLYAPIVAAIDAVADDARRAALRASALAADTYHYTDALALIAVNQDILPSEIASLTEAQMQAMWATTLTERPE